MDTISESSNNNLLRHYPRVLIDTKNKWVKSGFALNVRKKN